MRRPVRPAVIALVLTLAACGGSAGSLVEGDPCETCRMAITDTRFGGQVVLTTGRTRSFDAIECLASWLATGADSARIEQVLVSDVERATLIDASTALFVRDGAVASPMGRSIVALRPDTPREAALARYGGTLATWDEVRAALSTDRSAPAAVSGAPPHAH